MKLIKIGNKIINMDNVTNVAKTLHQIQFDFNTANQTVADGVDGYLFDYRDEPQALAAYEWLTKACVFDANTSETEVAPEAITITGTVDTIRKMTTKDNDVMAVIEVNHMTCVLFPNTWIIFAEYIYKGASVTIDGVWFETPNGDRQVNVIAVDGKPETAPETVAGDTDSDSGYTVEVEIFDDNHPAQTTSILKSPDGREVATKASRNAAIYMRDVLNSETEALRKRVAELEAKAKNDKQINSGLRKIINDAEYQLGQSECDEFGENAYRILKGYTS